MDGVYVIGSIVFDSLVRPVERLPAWGSAENVESISYRLGGNGAGAAGAAAAMGVPVRLAGAVGRDAAGEFALERLKRIGVDLTAVRVRDDRSTAATVALIRADGERLFLQEVGASAELVIDDIPLDSGSVRGCRFFHYATPFCLAALRPDAERLLARARRAGLKISLDLDWDPAGEWLRHLEPLCPLLDILFLNLTEARMLIGEDDPERVGEFFRGRGVGIVVLKQGVEGCRIWSAAGTLHEPAFAVEAVDTTGAGDCFCGVFLAALCRGVDLGEAARSANAAAAYSIRRARTEETLPDYETLRAWAAHTPQIASET